MIYSSLISSNQTTSGIIIILYVFHSLHRSIIFYYSHSLSTQPSASYEKIWSNATFDIQVNNPFQYCMQCQFFLLVNYYFTPFSPFYLLYLIKKKDNLVKFTINMWHGLQSYCYGDNFQNKLFKSDIFHILAEIIDLEN